MIVTLDQTNRGPTATRAVPRGADFRTGDEPLLLRTEDFPAGRPPVVEPGRSGPESSLLPWTVPLIYCSGLCGLAVSPVLAMEVPRWVILGTGLVCALLALLVPVVKR
jgi:hypothetical protein